MAVRCPTAKPRGKAFLKDYKLTFQHRNPSSGIATIVPKKGSIVQGGLWKIKEKDLQALDRYKGYPKLYDHDIYKVELGNGDISECFSYFKVRKPLILARPSYYYLSKILTGYRDFGLDTTSLRGFIKEM
ncbi:MAG: gamma-glutamylcyclotransferase family protein [bacterium]